MDSNFKDVALNYFRKYDTNNSHYIELGELKNFMADIAKDIGIPAPEESEISELLKEYDTNKDKKISESEFLNLFQVIYEMQKNK